MKLLNAILFALIIGLSLTSAGCFMDDVAVEPAVVYRSGFGYGYWYNSYWYPAPNGYVYSAGARPYWGPHCRHYSAPPRPYYNGGYYHGGYNGYHGSYGGYHGGYRGGGWHHR